MSDWVRTVCECRARDFTGRAGKTRPAENLSLPSYRRASNDSERITRYSEPERRVSRRPARIVLCNGHRRANAVLKEHRVEAADVGPEFLLGALHLRLALEECHQ